MHCVSCNEMLTDSESCRKDPLTKEYLDLCSYCLSMSKPYNIERIDEESKYLKFNVDKE